MSSVDLQSHRLARGLRLLSAAKREQAALNTPEQLRLGREMTEAFAAFRSEGEATIFAGAVSLVVDGLCNDDRVPDARRFADDALAAFDINFSHRFVTFSKGPRSLPGYQVARMHAHVLELGGDPEEAVHLLLGWERAMARHPEIGDSRGERLLALRHALSAAKRANTAHAHRFARLARMRGDPLAGNMQDVTPAAVASYLHRAAMEARTRDNRRATSIEAIDLLRESLRLRPSTRRSGQTRGMARGEILVLDGQRERGARVLSHTVRELARVLPRHHQSAREQLVERDLLRAA